MSFALKKSNFQAEIRRENLYKILRRKKLQHYASIEVNQVLIQYLDQYQNIPFPKLCALKYQFIEEENLFKLIDLIKLGKLRLDVTKPEQIALLSKMSVTDSSLIMKYFEEVIDFAERFIYRQKCFHQDPSKELQDQKIRKKIPSNLKEDAIYLPNCLLEFWARFFSVVSKETIMEMKTYCTILRAFISWFSPNSLPYQNFNKYSVCEFLRNFFESEGIFMFTCRNQHIFGIVQELHIRFRIACMPLILKLLKNGCFCEELIDMMAEIKSREVLLGDFLRALIEGESSKSFFNLLLDGLDNQNLLIFTENQLHTRFFRSQNLTQDQLQNLSELSVENILIKNVSKSIWKCKTKLLDIFNGFLTANGYENILFHCEIEEIIEKLVKTYIYCTDQGDTTSQTQKTICIIFYNILVLFESYSDSDQITECLNIHTEERENVQKRFRDYFLKNLIHFSEIINKTQYTSYDHIVDLISTLMYFSEFFYKKQVDEEIMIKGRLVKRICEAVNENIYNEKELKKIMDSLFEFLKQLHENSFDFSIVANDLIELQNAPFDNIITEEHEKILMKILRHFERENPVEKN